MRSHIIYIYICYLLQVDGSNQSLAHCQIWNKDIEIGKYHRYRISTFHKLSKSLNYASLLALITSPVRQITCTVSVILGPLMQIMTRMRPRYPDPPLTQTITSVTFSDRHIRRHQIAEKKDQICSRYYECATWLQRNSTDSHRKEHC